MNASSQGAFRSGGAVLREVFDYEFSRLDPTGPHIDPPHVAVYEVLVVKGSDRQAHTCLATDWETSADGLEWRWRLRPGVRFHSGARCDAAAVVRALEHLRLAFPPGQLCYWDPVESVRVEDTYTLVFRLHHPYVRLPSLLWGAHSTIYNESMRARHPTTFGFEMADGTGPFRLASWAPDRIVASRFDGYHGAGSLLDGIEWVSILDEQGRLDALERRDAHILHGPPLGEVDRLRDDLDLVVHEFPQASNLYLALDWRRTDLGFDDLRVRQAISLAIDRDEIVATAFSGRGSATWGLVPPVDEYFDPRVEEGRVRDPRRAVALLQEVRGSEPIRCRCVVQDDSVFRRVARLVQTQLGEIGVHLELEYAKPFEPFYDACAAGPPALLSKWLWQDAVDAVNGFTSSRFLDGDNWQHSSIPALDDAFQSWLRAETEAELQEAASLVQRIASHELPYIPLATPSDVWVQTKDVLGFCPDPSDLYPRYGGVSLETRA